MSTVAAISTGRAPGGIGVIRISGENAIDVADKVFSSFNGKKLCDIPGYSALYGKAFDVKGNIDNVVALLFRAPKSYTGEDVVEISCHGGLFVTDKVLKAVYDAGAIPAILPKSETSSKLSYAFITEEVSDTAFFVVLTST